VTLLDAGRRRVLRAELLGRHAWVADDEVGPRTVDAGECDRCGDEARMVSTCGPTSWPALGVRCALELGAEAWCDGHAGQARSWLAWLAALPAEADAVARLWWVATGEVRLDPALIAALERAALPQATTAAQEPGPASGGGTADGVTGPSR
jgi:hypothetical protein